MMKLNDFKSLLTRYTGLAMTGNDQDKLLKFLNNRLLELKLADLSDYLDMLAANTLAADQEWQAVVQALTVPESFFLRDKGQMNILQNHILPELIQRNQQSRQLRIWSAGCSTGEEPYSLALLLHKLLPDAHEWDVLILGTDINDKVLTKARAGLYSTWSLRDIEPEILGHFQPEAHGLLSLDASIREKVSFRRVNLLQTPFPDLEINNIDLILCRNVFIYFDPEAIATVLEKFVPTLKPDGYLITGHGELYQQSLNGLRTRLFLESVVYQRTPHTRPEHWSLPLPKRPLSPVIAVAAPSKQAAFEEKRDTTTELSDAYQRGDYPAVLATAQKKLLQTVDFESYYWSAKAYASLGQYHTAETRLQSALALDARSARCYYLLAHIKESQSEIEQAELLLNQVIALDETFIPAYLELAVLYEQDDEQKHREMREQALRLLNRLPSEHYFADYDAHAGDLIRQLQQA